MCAAVLAKPEFFVEETDRMDGRGPALVHDAKTCAWCGFYGDELLHCSRRYGDGVLQIRFLTGRICWWTLFFSFLLALMWHHSSSASKSDSRAAMHLKTVILSRYLGTKLGTIAELQYS